MFKLAEQINEWVHLYDSVISDDAGGRLVSLFLRKIINAKREKMGLRPIETRFIAGGRGMGKERKTNIEKFLRKNQKILGKALLVCEYIETGASLVNLGQILESAGIDFDIAILTSLHAYNIGEVESRISGHRIFVGASPSNKGLMLYNERHMAGGVYKMPGSASPFPKRYEPSHNLFDDKTKRWVSGQEAKKVAQERKKQTMEDISLLAERVLSLIS